jgi:hypothetical protein
MTREAAVKKVKGYLTDYLPIEDYKEVEEIIKALEPKPCEDTISRTEAKELAWDLELETCYDNEKVVEMLDDLPSVTPKGEWVKVKNGRGGHECNICHTYAPSYQNGDEYLSRFCPNCGAKMDERKSE